LLAVIELVLFMIVPHDVPVHYTSEICNPESAFHYNEAAV